MEFLTTALFCLSQLSMMAAFNSNDEIPGIPGVPDKRDMKVKISRGSGMGWIHPGFILLCLFALVLFGLVFWMIVFYKRKEERADKRILYLTSY